MGPQRRGLTIQQKLQVIQYSKTYHCGIRTLGQVFGISKSCASDILKQEARLLTKASQGGGHINRMKLSTRGEEMDNIIYDWYKKMTDNKEPVNNFQIQDKALEVAEYLKIPNFQASSGWLSKFRQRHGISRPSRKVTQKSPTVVTTIVTFNESGENSGSCNINRDPLETWPNLDKLEESEDTDVHNSQLEVPISKIKNEETEVCSEDPPEEPMAIFMEDNIYESIYKGNREINNYGEALKCVQALKQFLSKIGHTKALNKTTELECHFKDITSDNDA